MNEREEGDFFIKYNKEIFSIVSDLKQILEGTVFRLPQPQPVNRFSSDKFLNIPLPSPIHAISSEFPYPNSSFLTIPPKFKSHMIRCLGLAP
jgi:hypothetical protein